MSGSNATTRPAERVDVLIVGSGPSGSTYGRVVGDALPDATILMVEVGPRLSERIGEHAMNMSDDERIACQMLAQGPDAGTLRPPLNLVGLATDTSHTEMSAGAGISQPQGITSERDTSGETRHAFVFPGLFLLGERSRVDGEVGLPLASMSSGVGGMGVFWGGSCPRPSGSERIPFIPAAELDTLYDTAEQLLAVSKDLQAGDELLAKLRDVIAAEFDGEATDGARVGFMPVAVAVTPTGRGPPVLQRSLATSPIVFRASRSDPTPWLAA